MSWTCMYVLCGHLYSTLKEPLEGAWCITGLTPKLTFVWVLKDILAYVQIRQRIRQWIRQRTKQRIRQQIRQRTRQQTRQRIRQQVAKRQ